MAARRALAALLLVAALLPGRPAAGAGRTLTVAPGGDHATLAAALAAAQPGDTVRVLGGTHPAPVTVDKAITLVGVDRPRLDGGGAGTLVRITAAGARLSGFHLRGSGRSLDQEHSGIWIAAPRVTVDDNMLEDVLFGIVAKDAAGSEIRGNQVTGKRDIPESEVGDGIRVWHSHGTRVLDNTIQHSRDFLVEQTEGAVIRGNTTRHSGIGLHLMRSSGTTVEHNQFSGNSVGMYAMQAAGLTARHNRILDNRGPSGYGIGLKDMEGVTLESNWVVRNRVGMYIDNSPIVPSNPNHIRHNVILNNDVGILFTPVTNGNRVGLNDFVDNLEQIGVTGGGRLGANDWSPGGAGNYWSNYAGYDAGQDGTGDLPHQEEGLFEQLMDRQPALRWFRFSPAALAVDLAARAFPAVAPEPRVTDAAPRMAPALQVEPLPPAGSPRHLLAVGLGFLALAALTGLPTLLRRPRLPALAKGSYPRDCT